MSAADLAVLGPAASAPEERLGELRGGARVPRARGTSEEEPATTSESAGEECGAVCCAVRFPGGLKGRGLLAFTWSSDRPLSER